MGFIGEGGRAEGRLHQLCSSRYEDEAGQLDLEEQRKGCGSVVSLLDSLNEVQVSVCVYIYTTKDDRNNLYAIL